MENTGFNLKLTSLCKSFKKTIANKNISFEINCGEIFALVGQNGAGKTTLVSILAGQCQPDSGNIYINNERVVLSSTSDAIKRGISVVYQENKLVDTLTVSENIFLSKKVSFFSSRRKQLKKIQELIDQFSLTIELEKSVDELSMGEKQQVEILKSLYQESDFMIFDEATSLLNKRETEQFFLILKRLKERNKTILLITHNLNDVKKISDKVCVLQSGSVVGIDETSSISIQSLAAKMIGEVKAYHLDKKEISPKQILLKTRNLTAQNIKEIDLSIRQGEIFSVVGMTGNGQKELIESLVNRKKIQSGEYSVLGESFTHFFNKKDWTSHLSYIPEDRFNLATDKKLTILETFLLTAQYHFTEGGLLKKDKAQQKVVELLDTFTIKATGPEMVTGELSGGNLQKLILARAFFTKPKVMIVENPTQGLDITATHEIWQLLLNAREQAAIFISTADLSEAASISDRIGIMHNGRITEVIETSDKDDLIHLPERIACQGEAE